MSGNFKGKKCLVTGASRGIGKAIVAELHSQGAIIYAISKNPENLVKLKEEFPCVITIPVDLVKIEETKKVVESIEPLDVLINNAGIVEPCKFMEISGESFTRVFNVNLKAPMIISQIVAKKMIAGGIAGSIVNISSMLSLRPVPLGGIYPCTKAGLDMLTKIMATDLGPHKIRVNSLNPGFVLTDMISPQNFTDKLMVEEFTKDMKRVLERTPTNTALMPMSDVVNAALFLASNQVSQLTGQCLAVDGGYLAH